MVIAAFVAGLVSSLVFTNVFLHSSKQIIITPRCFIDAVSGATRDDTGFSARKSLSPITVQGWFANTGASISSDNVVVNLVDSDSKIIDSLTGIRVIRDDVAQVLNDPLLSKSGFNVEGSNPLKPGIYSIHITGEFGDHLEICRDTPQLIINE